MLGSTLAGYYEAMSTLAIASPRRFSRKYIPFIQVTAVMKINLAYAAFCWGVSVTE
jgi:hypothetical protein